MKDKCQFTQTFQDLMTDVHMPNIRKTMNDISEDRRKWVVGQAGNTLLYRSASSIRYYLENPGRRPSSLNEAITLRQLAFSCFEDEKQFDENCKRITASFSPSAPVTIVEDNAKKEEIPAFVTENEDELEKIEAESEAMLEKNLPLIAGFLDGAKYDLIDIPPTEWMADRARLSACKVFAAMLDRCQQDVLFIGGKWKAAKAAHNEKLKLYWNGEGFFATEDRKVVRTAIKQGGYELES
jgi:hypothetical protein